jgi:PAS domain S-box-containing protein
MARTEGRQAARTRPPAAYASHLDQDRLHGEQQALALLSSILTAPQGCAIIASAPDGAILAWSQTAVSLLGYRAGAVVGRKNWADLLPERAPQEALPGPLAAALQDGAWEGLAEFLRSSGEPVTCQVSVSRLTDTDGGVFGLLTLAREASRGLRQVADLQDAVARAQALLRSNPVPTIATDPLGVATDVNAAAEELLGRPAAALAGTRATSMFGAGEQIRSAITGALREGTVTGVEAGLRRAAGPPVPVSLQVAASRGRDGKLTGFVISLTDLTRRQQGRTEQQQSEAYHRELIEAAGDGLVVVDPAGLITDVNGQACTLFGFRREELIGAPVTGCFAGPDQVTEAVRRALAGVRPDGIEVPLAGGAGPGQAVALSASVFRDPGSGEPRVILSLHDVTEQAALRDRLAEERAYNRSVIESSANGLVMVDLRDRIADVNETICKLAGRRRQELIGGDFADFFTEPDAATAAVHHALATGSTTRCQLRLATQQRPQLVVSISLIRTSTGEVVGVLASARDVSEETRLQRALAAEQAYNRALIDSSLAGLFVLSPDGQITDVNALATRLTGHPRARLVGRQFATLFARQEEVRAAVAQAFTDGFLAEHDLVLAAAGPGRITTEVSGGVFTDPRGGGEALLAVVRDVTQQRQAAQKERFYLDQLFDAIVDAFTATDVLGTIVDVNRPMEVLVGRPVAELAGHPLDEYFTEPERAREFLAAVMREGKMTDYELTARKPDGSTTVVSYSGATYTDSEGAVQGILASARDVSDRKRFELLQASLLDRARELDQAKTDFVSRVSHELRSPLTSMLGYLELLASEDPGQLTEQQRGMLEVISRNGQRLLGLIEDLLLLSRIDAGTMAVLWEPLELDALVRGVHEAFTAAISRGQLTSRLEVEPGLRMEGDARQLRQLVAHLLSNAVKFTPPGGQLSLTARQAGEEIIVEVTDTGIGIPEAEQPRLFTRFFRAAMATQRETQGTGLGLFVVKQVAQAHGGRVTVASAPGTGSTFTVRLPARAPARLRRTGEVVPQ